MAAVRLILRSDWNESLRQNEGQAWVTCKTVGEPGIQGELKSHGTDENGVPQISASEGFTVTDVTKRSLVLSYPDKRITTKFIAPSTSHEDTHKKSICSLDISSGGGIGVTASDDGTLKVWQTSDGLVRRDLKGHVGEVTTCQFFPSGIVLLSGGVDMQLKIWSAEDGSCPVTLRGHSKAICSTDIIDKGRNIVSCSRDGSARLWDCGQSKCLATVYKGACPINDCAVGIASNCVDLGTTDDQPSEREAGTEGKLLLLATDDGELIGVGLLSRKKVFQITAPSSFNCCAFLSPDIVLGGTEEGQIYVVDIRNPSEPKEIIHRSPSPVLCIKAYKEGFIAGTGDGSCFYLNLDTGYLEEFTGPDCDAIFSVSYHGNHLYTACRDHIVRKYLI